MSVTRDCVAAFTEALGSENVHEHEPLSGHTSFEIGGPAALFVTPESIEQVQFITRYCSGHDVPLYVLGLGCNLLVCDDGVDGVVMCLADKLKGIDVTGNELRCLAGSTNKEVAETAAANGLAGYEYASGIPGTIGGAAIMNAGAYGGEFKDVAVSVLCVEPQGELLELNAEQAEWGYRSSRMMRDGLIVVAATLSLAPDDEDAIRERMADFKARREEKQPLEYPSAGSTFKRPEGYFAGKLIQDAGLKGFNIGGAQVSTKHSGFVINTGGATAQDVLDLIHSVQDRVFEMEGVRLEPEVRMWGFEN